MNGESLIMVGLNSPDRNTLHPVSTARTGESLYHPQEQATISTNGLQLLNDVQIHVFRTVINSVEYQQGGFIFLDAPVGNGMTCVTHSERVVVTKALLPCSDTTSLNISAKKLGTDDRVPV